MAGAESLKEALRIKLKAGRACKNPTNLIGYLHAKISILSKEDIAACVQVAFLKVAKKSKAQVL